MLRLLLRPALTLITILTGLTLLLVGVTSADAPPPLDLFTHPACEHPCWQGLQPGAASAGDVRAHLEAQGARYTDVSFIGSSDSLITTGRDGVDFLIPYNSTIIAQISYIASHCPARFVLSAGLPEHIIQTRDGNLFIIYPAQQFAVFFDQHRGHIRTKTVMLATEDRLQTLIARETTYGGARLRWRQVEGRFRGACP